MIPISEGIITSKTIHVALIGAKLIITAGWMRLLVYPSIVALKLLRWAYLVSRCHYVPGARSSANRSAKRWPSERIAPISPPVSLGYGSWALRILWMCTFWIFWYEPALTLDAWRYLTCPVRWEPSNEDRHAAREWGFGLISALTGPLGFCFCWDLILPLLPPRAQRGLASPNTWHTADIGCAGWLAHVLAAWNHWCTERGAPRVVGLYS